MVAPWGSIDRPVYMVCKVTGADEVRGLQGVEELYAANGFVFFRRDLNATFQFID